MLILFDTNVILDVLAKREPFYQNSGAAIKFCSKLNYGCLSIVQCRDIHYLLCKSGLSSDDSKLSVTLLLSQLKLLIADDNDVKNALSSEMSDFEDALLAYCAARHDVQYIITRNEKDFVKSPVKVISPHDFLLLQNI